LQLFNYKIFTALFVLIGGLYGCHRQEINSGLSENKAQSRSMTNITPIGAIKLAPNQQQQSLYFQGKVVKYAPMLAQQGYQISDATGKIWVFTRRQNHWQIGQDVSFKGKVKYDDITLAGIQYGEVYLEQE